VTLFHSIQQEGSAFVKLCANYFCNELNTAERYYELREAFNRCDHPRRRAALFLYLNRHGYNGLCRYNAKGLYNVPFGRYQKPYFPAHELLAFHNKSKHAEIMHADFRETFTNARLGDVIYCDPPYSPLTQASNFSAYTSKRFGVEEHLELKELALNTSAKGIPVIISNHDTPFTREQYRDGSIHSFAVKRSISCKGHQRKTVNELIAVFHAH
jgi:DNA adenine methylase